MDFTANVVSFVVENNPKGQRRVQLLASATGGRYLDLPGCGRTQQSAQGCHLRLPSRIAPPAKPVVEGRIRDEPPQHLAHRCACQPQCLAKGFRPVEMAENADAPARLPEAVQ